MKSNIKNMQFYHDKNNNISYVKCGNIGYKIGNNIIKCNNEEIDNLIVIENLCNNQIVDTCKFEFFILFMKDYIRNECQQLSIQELIDHFHIKIFNKNFILDRPKCFSSISKLVKIKKNKENEYEYHFKYNNERCAMTVFF